MNRRRSQRRPSWWLGCLSSIILFIFFIACVKPPQLAGEPNPKDHPLTGNAKKILEAGDVLVNCEIQTPFGDGVKPSAKGTLHIKVHQSLAPLASKAFLDMVASNHFSHNYLFRSVEGFIVQWGIESPKPAEVEKGDHVKTKFPNSDIDPLPKGGDPRRSNVRGALNFAGGNSANGQVYINRKNNPHLDKEPGAMPFATLDEDSMAIIDDVYSYKEGLGQVKAVKKGDEEVRKLFPKMSRIESCVVDDN